MALTVEQYTRLLTPVLPIGEVLPDNDCVCPLCFTYVPGPYTECRTCRIAAARFDHRLIVPPMALAVKGGPLATWLWRYKNHEDEGQRQRNAGLLQYLVSRWMARHELCVAELAGVDGFDLVTWVPSSSTTRVGLHPLEALFLEVPSIADRLLGVLSGKPAEAHELDADRFTASTDVRGQRVLLLDDTYTTGYSLRQAAHALRIGGARAVGAAVVGRHFVRGYEAAEVYYGAAMAQHYDWDTCVLEAEPTQS